MVESPPTGLAPDDRSDHAEQVRADCAVDEARPALEACCSLRPDPSCAIVINTGKCPDCA